MANKPLLAVQVIRQHLTYLDETPFNQIDTKLLRRIKLAVAECKHAKICAYCGDKLKVKDFRTRADKDEYAISGMCQPCIDKSFLEEDEEDRYVSRKTH